MGIPVFSAAELAARGLSQREAEAFVGAIGKLDPGMAPAQVWQWITRNLLRPEHPTEVHEHLYRTVFADWDPANGPAPAWFPENPNSSNIAWLMREAGAEDYRDLHSWSVSRPLEFWGTMVGRLGVQFSQAFLSALDLVDGPEHPHWFAGASLNVVDSCFRARDDSVAVIYQSEDGPLERMSVAQLRTLVARVANGLKDLGIRAGDRIALAMPMTVESVAIYLGAVAAGLAVVTIADSFAVAEISVRLKIAAARCIFTQDFALRRGKLLPLYEKMVAAGAPRAIVVPCGPASESRSLSENRWGDLRSAVPAGSETRAERGVVPTGSETRAERGVVPCGRAAESKLRDADLAWQDFLSARADLQTVPRDPTDFTTILFSSGTTASPKAIPWDQTTPIKSAIDAHLHHDIHPGDVLCWPTNMGWMMGPWLVYAALMNKATMALYYGVPTARDFGQFVQDAGVTMLGLVPSLVSAWRSTGCLDGLNWSSIRAFSSTGECSNPQDMLFLMSRAGYKPVIEYCGGTEIGGGYITGTVVQPAAPATFSTPALGTNLVILDEQGLPAERGELFLIPPSLGLSVELLNGDHHAVYYAGTPRGPQGELLRRHGDRMQQFANGYFRAHGRVDDSMNLGGIKVSSLQIEEVIAGVQGVRETAAIAVSPPAGGPSLLVLYVVPSGDVERNAADLQASMQEAIRTQLNPLFKVHDVVVTQALPRTASNKVMRRTLRAEYERRTMQS